MKKLTIYAILMAFASLNIFGSCEEEMEKKAERVKASKRYLATYKIYDNIDSAYTDITVYVGVVDGHKYRYHLFNGKNKSQMEVEHMVKECKECNKHGRLEQIK